MKLSLSEISTVGASFAEDVAAYAEAGFDGIGLWEFKLPADDAANLALLDLHGLRVANCVPSVPAFLQLAIPGLEGPADPAERLEAICASIRRLAPYRPASIVCPSGPLGGRSEAEGRAILCDGLRQAAEVARAHGIRLGLEPVHPSNRETVGFITSLAAAAALLDEPGLGDVGIMFDTWHAWDDPSAAEWLAGNIARVSGVHVADWPTPARDDRVLPGEGGGRSRELVAAVRAAGWSGFLDVEIFSTPEAFWGLPVAEAARRAHAAAGGL